MKPRAEVGAVRLLLVSDHHATGDALTAYLERHGIEVVARVATPRAAAEAAQLLRPDVALVDAEVSCGWRSVVVTLGSVLNSHHIALLSAYWSQQERREASRTGVGATILKRVAGGALVLQLRSLAA